MGLKQDMKQGIKRAIRNYIWKKVSQGDVSELNYSKKINLNTFLTNEEKCKIKSLWGGVVPKVEDGYLAYRIYKQLHGFDEHYVPVPYYYPYIMWRLNDKDVSHTLAHKGLLPIYFNDVYQPPIIINCINGNIFNNQRNIISTDDVIKLLRYEHRRVIIKRSIDSYGGKSIQIIDTKQDESQIGNILKSYGTDYVIQELVEQSQVTAQLNPTSLQTMRISTLFINGECTAVKTSLRCGGEDSVVDNMSSGGFMVKINSTGRLNEFGYSFDGRVHTCANGHKLSDVVIPNIQDVVNTAVQAHIKDIPNCSFVGWDFALDKDNRPILIEANLKFPSCFGVQLSCGPIFGDRTQEVIDYVKKHQEDTTRFFY